MTLSRETWFPIRSWKALRALVALGQPSSASGLLQEALARLDVWIGTLMNELVILWLYS
jgi:hypothetical protein